jgi:hypothetical protein
VIDVATPVYIDYAYHSAGTGKTTAIQNVPHLLIPHLESTGGKRKRRGIATTLTDRLESWRTTQGPLVFHIDYSVCTGGSHGT